MSDSAAAMRYLDLTAEIAAAHVGNNPTAVEQLPGLIELIYRALATIERGPAVNGKDERPAPAVPIKRSIFDDHIVCLEDGKKLTMLKRHLKTAYDMTPAQYRERWGLPSDYPMVAPAYAARRSVLAKQIGLGRKQAEEPKPEVTKLPPRRARGSRG